MGLIVPDAVEQYLAGLNQLADPVLRELERDGKEQKLPLIDAEVGALLRVLATTIGGDAHPRDRHRDRLLGNLARGRAASTGCC